MTKEDQYSEAAAYIQRTIPISDIGGRMVMAAFLKDSIDQEFKEKEKYDKVLQS